MTGVGVAPGGTMDSGGGSDGAQRAGGAETVAGPGGDPTVGMQAAGKDGCGGIGEYRGGGRRRRRRPMAAAACRRGQRRALAAAAAAAAAALAIAAAAGGAAGALAGAPVGGSGGGRLPTLSALAGWGVRQIVVNFPPSAPPPNTGTPSGEATPPALPSGEEEAPPLAPAPLASRTLLTNLSVTTSGGGGFTDAVEACVRRLAGDASGTEWSEWELLGEPTVEDGGDDQVGPFNARYTTRLPDEQTPDGDASAAQRVENWQEYVDSGAFDDAVPEECPDVNGGLSADLDGAPVVVGALDNDNSDGESTDDDSDNDSSDDDEPEQTTTPGAVGDDKGSDLGGGAIAGIALAALLALLLLLLCCCCACIRRRRNQRRPAATGAAAGARRRKQSGRLSGETSSAALRRLGSGEVRPVPPLSPSWTSNTPAEADPPPTTDVTLMPAPPPPVWRGRRSSSSSRTTDDPYGVEAAEDDEERYDTPPSSLLGLSMSPSSRGTGNGPHDYHISVGPVRPSDPPPPPGYLTTDGPAVGAPLGEGEGAQWRGADPRGGGVDVDGLEGVGPFSP